MSKGRQRCKPPQQQDQAVTTGRTWPDVVAEAKSNLATARLCACLLCIGGLGGLGLDRLVSWLQHW